MKSSLNPEFRQAYAIAKAIPWCITKEMNASAFLLGVSRQRRP